MCHSLRGRKGLCSQCQRELWESLYAQPMTKSLLLSIEIGTLPIGVKDDSGCVHKTAYSDLACKYQVQLVANIMENPTSMGIGIPTYIPHTISLRHNYRYWK